MSQSPAVIFHVEENRILSLTLRDVLEFAGWYVKPCHDPYVARATLERPEHFDLVLLDNDLRYLGGLELVRLVRRLPHRRQTPIILISLEDCGAAALDAGANAFLRKPNNLFELADTIRRLLAAAAPAGK